MASVFLAVQESLGRQVAIKVLAPALAAQQGFTRRFLNEGRIIAYLKHPRIVSIYDLGSHEHDYYISMELLPAGALEQRIKAGIGIVESVRIVKFIAEALGFAHQQGVIHRDIKPQNILFREDGLPVLTDFGIARLIDGGPHLTIPGRTLGSPLYMSPEQISGHRADGRADLYAMGVLMYNMLTRKLPYQSDQLLAVALMHKTAPIPVLPDNLSAFQTVLNRLLAKAPDDRFDTAQELIDALTRIESTLTLPEDGTPRLTDGDRQPVRQTAAGRIRLPDLSPIRLSDDFSRHALEPTQVVSEKPASEAGQDQEGLLPEPGIPAANRRVDVAPFRGTAVGKKAVLSMSALAVALAIVVLWAQPFSGSEQPSPIGVASVENDFFRPYKAVAPSNLPQPAKIPLPSQAKDQATRDREVAELLAKARKQLSRFRLTSPAGDNCYETYRQIVALAPGSQAAESIKIRIAGAYGRLAHGAKADGRLKLGLQYIDTGLKMRPDDPALLALQAELRAGIAAQTRLEIEQARKTEQQERAKVAARAALEEKQRAEHELAEQRIKEVQKAQMVKQSAEQVEKGQPGEKFDIGHSETETIGKEWERQSRLFGTF